MWASRKRLAGIASARPDGSKKGGRRHAALGRAVAEALEQRQLLTVSGATITGPSQVPENTTATYILSATDSTGNGTDWAQYQPDGTYSSTPFHVDENQTYDFNYSAGDEGSDKLAFHVTDDSPCCSSSDPNTGYDTNPPQYIEITDSQITFTAAGNGADAVEGDGSSTIVVGTLHDDDPNASPDDYPETSILWGDGSETEAKLVPVDPGEAGGSAFEVQGTHQYAEEGSFTASVNIQDDGGQTASGQTPVTVADASISVSVGDPAATEGKLFSDTVVGTLTDTNPNAASGDFSGTIDWGDGHTSPAGFAAVPDQPGTFNILGTHTFAEEAAFDLVTITAQDKGGAKDGNVNFVAVADAPISLSPGNFFAATEGVDSGVLVLGTLTDTNQSAPASDFTNNVTIAWGDGNTSQATLVPQGYGVFSVQGNHTYAEEGLNVQVTLNATDAGGSTATPVTVTGNVYDAPISVTPQGVGVIEGAPTGDMLVGTLQDTNRSNTDATDFSGTASYASDGSSAGALSFTPIGPGSFSVWLPSTTYSDEGTFGLQLAVSDIGGSIAAPATTQVAVGEGAMAVALASNIIPVTADAKTQLVALNITTHPEADATWGLSFVAADTARIDVWTTPTPGPGDTPLLGLIGNKMVDNVGYAAGSQVPSTLYVGAYAGSSIINDIVFALAEGDPKSPAVAVHSPPATAVSFQIHSLGFGGDGQSSIQRDNGSGAYDQTTQWLDGNMNGQIDGMPNAGGTIDSESDNEHQYPLSYVRSIPNTPDVMQVTITLAGALPQGILVEGSTNYDGITFTPTIVSASNISADGTTTTLTLTANTPLQNTIDSKDMTITWEYAVAPGTFKTGEQTTNHLYVTGTTASNAFETVLNIGCNAAVGLRPHEQGELGPGATGADQQIVDAIWSQFTGLSVKRVDNIMMRYNHDRDTGISAADMLGNPLGKGQCTAWAGLLVLVLNAQNVAAEPLDIASNQVINHSAFTVKLMPAQGSLGNNYTVGTTHFNAFRFHQIVNIDCYPDRLFDPSYGGTATAVDGKSRLAVYEDQSLVDVLNGAIWDPQTPGVEDLLINSPEWFIWH